MKRSLIVLLAMILLLTGCSLRFTLPEETEATVTVPSATAGQTKSTEESAEAVPTAPDGHPRELDGEGRIIAYFIGSPAFTLGDASAADPYQTCGYDGGEMRLPFQYVGGSDTDLAGLGLMVFLDGQPQPYKLAEDGEYEYMHVFTELEGEGALYFTPVCGKAGDELELSAVLLPAADWFPREKREGGQVKLEDYMAPYQLYSARSVVLQFNADPAPAANLPTVRDRVEELTVSEESLTETDQSDIRNSIYIDDLDSPNLSTDIRYIQRRAWNVYLGSILRWGYGQEEAEPRFEPTRGGQFAFNVKETSKVHIQCQICCEMPVDYSLVLYLNGEPVSVEPEDVVRFSGGNGETKMVARFTLDMTEMNEINKIFVMAVARNYQTLHQRGELGDSSDYQLEFKIIPMYTILTSYGNYTDYEKAVNH